MRNISYKTFIRNLFMVLNCVSLLLGSLVTVAESQTKRASAPTSITATAPARNAPVAE